MSRARLQNPKPAPSARMADLPSWMARTPSLQALKRQAADASQMWRSAAAALPAALVAGVTPGVCTDGSWTLVASSPAVAAKLKLFAPLLQRQLLKQGWPVQKIVVRVLPGAASGPRRAAAAATTPTPPSLATDQVRQRLRELRARWNNS